ncbi:MAG: TetR family transcriptional regulator [Actinomycetia bacterium]|nr:TetR family transcriptional regulator [Actinomycetes bacterium]MCH9702174.1 TetR family transcriptional regulator [Actinomycetes bacterium]MCH9762341.1 TetR family transcriptional regulator [Actinomycetes bacterium]
MDAATAQFAEHGFHTATLRGIAAAAGVDTALIRHYYGSKDDLFAATLQFAPETLARVVAAASGDPDHLGQRVVAAYLELWEDPTTAAPLHAAVRTAVSSTGGAALMQEFVQTRMLPVFTPVLDNRAALRVTLASSHMLGTAISRYVLRIEPLASLDRDELIDTLAPVIQRYLTGDLSQDISGPEADESDGDEGNRGHADPG